MRTDLAMHKGLLGRLEELGGEPQLGSMGSGRSTTSKQTESAAGEDFYHVIVPAILHAADLSNPTLDFQARGARQISPATSLDFISTQDTIV